jgi:dTDP-4-dehydrorhamnose reductase
MLGTALVDRLTDAYNVFATSRVVGYRKPGVHWETFDLLDSGSLIAWLTETRPLVVVHCAGIANVDACERDPQGALAVHVGSTSVIADTIAHWTGRVIYISTDSVFNGRKAGLYDEDDGPDPLNVYARSKREGEVVTLAAPRGTVLRTNIFGWSRADRCSFAEWILKGLIEKRRLSMFTDVTFTPLHVSHLAEVVFRLLAVEATGLFHATGSTVLSKHEFALKMAATFGLSDDAVVPSNIENASLDAPRARNMALSNRKLCAALGYQLPTADAGITHLKAQYDGAWLAQVKGRALKPGYCFWEAICER